MSERAESAALIAPPSAFAGLSAEEWLSTIKRSIKDPVFDGVRLPGFPPPEVQERFVGCSGQLALEEAFAFYAHACRTLNEYSSQLAPGPRGFWLIYAFLLFSYTGGLLVATSRNRWFIEHLMAQARRPRRRAFSRRRDLARAAA